MFSVIMYFVAASFSSSLQKPSSCLNLNGNWAGDCIYSSASYGELSGAIDFQFKQSSCDEIVINDQSMKIPGKFNQTVSSGVEVTDVNVILGWTDAEKQVMSYDYKMLTTRKDQVIDEVILKGIFFKKATRLIMQQQGTVDGDKVKIECEMRLNQ